MKKIKSIDDTARITALLELYDKNYKAVIINASMNSYKHIKRNEKNSLSMEIEDMNKYQMGNLEPKNTITKIKNSVNGLSYEIEETEDNIQ